MKLYLYLCILVVIVACNRTDKHISHDTHLFSSKKITKNRSTDKQTNNLYGVAKCFADWSKTHQEESERLHIDTISDQDNLFLCIRKDSSILLNKINDISNELHKMYATYPDHLFSEDISICSYKHDNFISFLYSVVDNGFRRDYFEYCATYIVKTIEYTS